MSRKGENIFKRKDGRWEARYIHHYENNKAVYRYLYGKTYTEVKQKRLDEQILQIPIDKVALHRDFKSISEEWLENIKHSVKESTFARYHRIVENHLIPNLSQKSIKTIDASDINKMVTSMITKPVKPLSPKTVSDIICVFKSIAKYGNNKKYFNINTDLIKYPAKVKSPIKTLDCNTIKNIENILLNSEDMLSVGIIFSLFTGVRIGELCGLRWEDIDLENKTVSIKRTVERIPDLSNTPMKTKVVVSTPKTESSYRIIPIQGFLKNRLEKFKTADSYYLLSGTEKYIEPHLCYIRYKKFLKNNNLGDYTFHALRHTFATRCVEAGIDVKSLSEILGHRSVTTTLSVYIHPSMEQKRAQMEKISPAIYL